MAYIVKDTFEYTGEEIFNTLEEFLQWFWQGSFEDFLSTVLATTDVDDAAEKIRPVYENIVRQDWNPDTRVYIRIVDFESPVNYLSNRMVVQSLPYTTHEYFQQIQNADTDLIKTTEIIG